MEPVIENLPGDNMDILIARYVTKDADPEGSARVERWIAGSEINKEYAEDLRLVWENAYRLAFTGSIDAEAACQQFYRRTEAKSNAFPQRHRGSLMLLWMRVAATIAVVATISLILLNRPGHRGNAPVILQNLSENNLQTDTLPDGSVVVLRPHSNLSYPSPFAPTLRNVKLAGGAFFTVTPDSRKTFRVVVNGISVTVLGTEFAIISSPDSTEIAVKKGIVEVSGSHQIKRLYAHEKLTVRKTDSIWVKEQDTLGSASPGRILGLSTEKNAAPATTNASTTYAGSSSRSIDRPLHALLVGDNAPILPLDKWIKGGPLNVYERGKVYLVDFWALWCGPCIAGMDKLSALQEKYKDQGLEVMSVTSGDAWGSSYDKVVDFINGKGQRFNYNFAWLPDSYRADHQYKSIIYNPWLELAYDSSSWALPQVFLIDKQGRIAFIGDGFALQEDYIVQVLENKHDLSQERKNYIEELVLENEVVRFLGLLREKKIPDAISKGKAIVENNLVTTHALLAMADDIFNKYGDLHSSKLIDLGFEAARKGVALTRSNSPSHLAVLAKGYSLLNKPQQAVETIQAAINLADGDFKAALLKDRKIYEQEEKK
jgi:ferric-dicitrate binding protein FerR (iron transport regulator)/thiol-disulfide isomerase/thioredoxin